MTSNKKVIIIDDDEEHVTLYKHHLKTMGYEAVGFTDSIEGLYELRNGFPDLALLDIYMPEYDGFAVLEELAKDEQVKEVPIFIVTGSTDEEDKLRADKLGVAGYFIKGIDDELLMERMKEVLG